MQGVPYLQQPRVLPGRVAVGGTDVADGNEFALVEVEFEPKLRPPHADGVQSSGNGRGRAGKNVWPRREVLDGVPRPGAAGQQQTGADQGGPPTAGSDLQATLSAWRSIQGAVVCTTDSTPPGILGTPEEGPHISLDQSHQTLADEPAMGRSPPFGLRTATNLAPARKGEVSGQAPPPTRRVVTAVS